MTVEQLFLDIFFVPVLLIGNLIFFIFLVLRQNSKLKMELEPIFEGINDLKKGEKLSLSEDGLLSEMKRQLNESSQIINNREVSRSQWIAGVSHDIRTPLSIILTNAELAHNLDYKYYDSIYSSAKRIKELIETLNMENRLFYGTEKFKLVSTQVFPLIQEALIKIINDQLEETDWISLNIEDSVKEASILVNKYLFKYLLEYLLLNIKERSKEVSVQVLKENKSVQIKIAGNPLKMSPTRRSDELSKKVILEIIRIFNGTIHSRINNGRFLIIMEFSEVRK